MHTHEHHIRTTPHTSPLLQMETPSGDPSFASEQFEPLLTAADAAHLLTLHPVTLLRWSREGRVPHIRLGRRVMFRTSELNSWLSNYNNGVLRAA